MAALSLIMIIVIQAVGTIIVQSWIFNEQWYVFYHRSTHNSKMMRKSCVETIFFHNDGSINEVEMTSQGAGPPLAASSQIDAERACLLFGNLRIQALSPDNEELGGIRSKDRVAYNYINFGDGVDRVTFRVKSGMKSGKIDLAIDMPWHQSIGTVEILGNEHDGEWQNITADIKKVIGVHALWLRFYGDEGELFTIDWFKFYKLIYPARRLTFLI